MKVIVSWDFLNAGTEFKEIVCKYSNVVKFPIPALGAGGIITNATGNLNIGHNINYRYL